MSEPNPISSRPRITRIRCGGKIVRSYGTYSCSIRAVFGVSPGGNDDDRTWVGACGHHLAQVCTQASSEHDTPRLIVVNLDYQAPEAAPDEASKP